MAATPLGRHFPIPEFSPPKPVSPTEHSALNAAGRLRGDLGPGHVAARGPGAGAAVPARQIGYDVALLELPVVVEEEPAAEHGQYLRMQAKPLDLLGRGWTTPL
jgi:hypothetical protein